MKKNNPLITKYGLKQQWVNFKLVKSGERMTKVPYSPVTGKAASSTDRETWSDFVEASEKSPNVGIIFTPEQLLLGIDIDHCLNGKTRAIEHEQADAIVELLLEADTYTEVSPSGEGLHLYLALTAPLALSMSKHAPYEFYTSGRYFTVTQDSFGKVVRDVRTVTPEEALKLLKMIGYREAAADPRAVGHEVFGDGASIMDKEHPSISDEEVLKRMFKSKKKGERVKALYNGDTSDYGKDESSADMALLSHLAFWTGKNADQMLSLWLSSPLGKRKKTQSRVDYQKRSIRNAISNCAEVYEPKTDKVRNDSQDGEEKEVDLDLLFTFNKDGDKVYTMNTENICRVLRRHPSFAGRFRFDVFKNRLEILKGEKWNEIEDNDMVMIQTHISILMVYFQKVAKMMVADALLLVCKENTIDSAADYVKSLVWDEQSRLDSWLTEVYGVPNDIYHQKVGSNWLKGLVNRIVHPGCKFDYVLVLEGPQGSRKSTSLAALGGLWHFETSEGTDSKDFFMQFEGKAIVEFSEGETLSRTEVKRMKAIITTQVDRYRPSYGRFSMDFPRRCIFAMTTNADEYLKDETGNRRWLPVKLEVVQANVEWIRENREQLLAEAYHRVITLKESTYDFPEEETLAAQNQRRVHDANADPVIDWYWNRLTSTQRADGITVHDAYTAVLQGGFSSKAMSKYEEISLANIFKKELGLEKVRIMRNRARAWRWYEEGKTPTETMFIIEESKVEHATSLEDF